MGGGLPSSPEPFHSFAGGNTYLSGWSLMWWGYERKIMQLERRRVEGRGTGSERTTKLHPLPLEKVGFECQH